MATRDKRVLRLKVNMSFGGMDTLPAGDYEGDAIPDYLEREFQSGSPHVEEVITKVTVSDEEAAVIASAQMTAEMQPEEVTPVKPAKSVAAKTK